MSTPPDEFVAHCLELFDPVDDLFVAIIAFDRLYLKTDAQTRELFERAACEPFVYDKKGGAVSLGYWSAPDEAIESPALMRPWGRLALEAALRARAAKPPRVIKTRVPAKAAAARGAKPSAGAKSKR